MINRSWLAILILVIMITRKTTIYILLNVIKLKLLHCYVALYNHFIIKAISLLIIHIMHSKRRFQTCYLAHYTTLFHSRIECTCKKMTVSPRCVFKGAWVKTGQKASSTRQKQRLSHQTIHVWTQGTTKMCQDTSQ